MKSTQNNPRLILLATFIGLSVFSPSPTYARGHIDGNGGDYIRGTYLKVGQAVLSYLHDSEEGVALLKKHALDEGKLSESLTIDVVSVDEGVLVDNGGSPVDAIGTPGSVVLSKSRWADHFQESRDVYYLVFHEMLRAAGVHDDNYLISGAINPFPASRRVVTRLTSVYPILGEDNLSNIIEASALTVNGSGCVLGRLGTSVEVDMEKNQIELSFRNNLAQTGGISGRWLDRKNCALALPVRVPAGKRLVISQVDMSAKLDATSPATAVIGLEAFLAGTQGSLQTKTLETGSEPVQGRLLLRRNELLSSRCGESDILRLNTSSRLHGQEFLSAKANVLEVDRITLSLKLESCAAESSSLSRKSSDSGLALSGESMKK